MDVGTSYANVKEISLSETGMTCPSIVDISNWVNGDTTVETFSISVRGKTMLVTRTDADNEGWDIGLKINCNVHKRGFF